MKLWSSRPSLDRYSAQLQSSTAEGGVTAWFLGTSSVLLSDGRTAVLSDGFVTRPGLARVLFGRIAPDERVVREVIERLGTPPLAVVVCVHSHYDHALDAPVWASLTGAELVGSESPRRTSGAVSTCPRRACASSVRATSSPTAGSS